MPVTSDAAARTPQGFRANEAQRWTAIILAGVTGNASAIIKPLLIGTYVAHYSFTPRAAGYLLTSEMTAAALAILVSAVLFAHLSQRKFVLAALVMILIGNVGAASIDVAGASSLFGWRIVAGLGHGFALGPVGAAVARVKQPDRLAGLMSVAVMGSAAALSFLIPHLQASIGGRGLFVAMAATIPLGVIAMRYFPDGAGVDQGKKSALPPMPPWRVTLFASLGLFAWYLVVGGYWPYVEQFARAAHLGYAEAARVLGWATLISVLGASLSIFVGESLGRMRTLSALFAIQIAAVLTMLLGGSHFFAYAASASLFVFAWIALFPYLMGLMSQIDPGGRLNGLLYMTALLGYAIGPAAAGYVSGHGATLASGLLEVQQLVLGLLLVAATMLLTLAARNRRPASMDQAAPLRLDHSGTAPTDA